MVVEMLKSNKTKFFIYYFISLFLIATFMFIPLKKIKVDSYSKNEKLVHLSDNIDINEKFNFIHENLDSLTFYFYKYKKNDNKQDIIFKTNGLSILNINEIKYEKSILIELLIDDSIYKKNISLSDIKSGKINETFGLKNIKYKDITINIKTNNISLSDNLYIFLNNQRYYTLKTSFDNKDYELSLTQYTHIPSRMPLIVFSIVLILILLFKNKKNKIYDSLKFSHLFILDLVLSIIFSSALLKFNINYSLYEKLSFVYFILTVASLILILKLMIESSIKYKFELEKVFALLMIFLGIIYTFSVVINGGPDETCHYFQAEELSEFKFKNNKYHKVNKYFIACNDGKGDYKCLSENVFGDNKKEEIVLNTAAVYNKILYIPAALGIKISKMLNMKDYVGYYIARIFDLLLIVFAGYYAIKLLPNGKLILFTFLLNPKFIAQSATISADVVTNAVSILFISLALSEGKFNKKKKILLIALLLLFLIIKKPYQIFALLLLLRIDKKTIDKWKNKILNKKNVLKNIVIFVILLSIGYLIIANLTYPVYDSRTLNSIVRDPLDFIGMIYNTFVEIGDDLFLKMLGGSISWHGINSIYVIFYIILLLISVIIDKVKLTKEQLLMYLILGCLAIVIIFAGFLVIYYDVGEEYIRGMQGRYFIPAAILILYSFSSILNRITLKYNKNKYILYFVACLIIIHLLMILQYTNYMM